MEKLVDTYQTKLLSFMPQVKHYENKLDTLNTWWTKVALIGKINSHSLAAIILEEMQLTQEKFSVLHNKLIKNLLLEHLRKVIVDNKAKSQVAIDILIRNLFERTADVGFLATDDDIRQFLLQNKNHSCANIESRLGEYVKKYSVYDEIIILNTRGEVCVHLDQSNIISGSDDDLLKATLNSREDYVETFRFSNLQAKKQRSLIYSCKITANNSLDSKVLGILCLCFRFNNEITGIFNKLLTDKETTLLFLSKQGNVIASSEPNFVPIDRHFDYIEGPQLLSYQGNEFLINCTSTNGYQGFYGLGWWAMVMTPANSAFKPMEQISDTLNDAYDLNSSQLFPQDLKDIHKSSAIVNDDLSLVVLNGQITALRQKSTAFMPVLEAIKDIGKTTSSIFSDSISELQKTVVSSHMNDVAFIAALAVDLMDRNLYERANDCRWWALTSAFRQILDKEKITEQDTQQLCDILNYINNLYTVYTNLYLFDKKQHIVAVSNSDQTSLIGQKVNEISGSTKALTIKNSQHYTVSEFMATHLYEEKYTYIYNAAVTSETTSQVVGGIGVVFDSEPQFEAMLNECLPQNEQGEIATGCFAVFTDRSGNIISSTNQAPYRTGELLPVKENLFHIEKGQSSAQIHLFQDIQYILGIAASSGYREYKTTGDYDNDVLSFIFIPL